MTDQWRSALMQLPTELVTQCALCREVDGVEDQRWGSFLALPPPYAVQRCPECSLRWLSPRPDARGYRMLYSNDSYFGGSGASPVDYTTVIAQRLNYFRKRIRIAASILQRDVPISVLDFGAATGDFVALARSEGHHCEGIELSDDARASAKERYNVSLLSLNQVDQLPPSAFDFLHMNHVLEHIPDPIGHLRWCLGMLKPDGLLFVEVPQQFDNDLDRARRFLRMGGRQARFDAYSLHHTYFFTPWTLANTLRAAGFEPGCVRTFNPDKTPMRPFNVRNWILRGFLGLADRHNGGNILEVFARPARSSRPTGR